MNFKKNLLVAAMGLSLPFAAGAVEVLDEEALDAVTGQDGITIQMNLNLNTDVTIHDLDGFEFDATPIDGTYVPTLVNEEGAIVIDGMGLVTGAGGVQVDIDAGDTAAVHATPTLNIAVSIPANTVITTGALGVANSNRDISAASTAGNLGGNTWGASTAVAIMDSSAITLGSTDLNIQLGNEPQGYMVVIGTIMSGGLSIANVGINDANDGGTIGMANLSLIDTGGANLTILAGIDVESDGNTATVGDDRLAITVSQLGSGAGVDLRMERVYLGIDPGTAGTSTVGYLGDVEVNGLTLTGTIYVTGH